jgi:tetratricopeptide (TPR) repeat protein
MIWYSSLKHKVIGICLVLSINAFSQNKELDSLLKTYQNHSISDSLRLDALCEICWEYIKTDASKIESFVGKLEELDSKVFPQTGYYKTKIVLGYYYKTTGNFDLSFKYFEDALNIYKLDKDTINIIRSLYRLGELRNNTHNVNSLKYGDYSYYIKGLDLLKHYPDGEQTIFFQNGMAMALTNEGLYDESLVYLKKSAPIYDTIAFPGKKRSLGFYYYHIGRNYFMKKLYNKALDEMKLAHGLANELYLEDLLLETNYYLGNIYLEIGDYLKAEPYFLNYVALNNKRGIKWKNMGMKTLLSFYERANMREKAFALIKPYLSIQDSVIDAINRDKYNEFEVKYKVQEKQFENDLLAQDLSSQKNKLLLTLIFGIIVTMLLIGIILLMQKLWKHNKKLTESDQYKNQILNVMGHDIRTPLVTQLTIMQEVFENKAAVSTNMMNSIYNLSLSIFKISDNVYNWVKLIKRSNFDQNSVTQINFEFFLVLEQYQPILNIKKINIVHNISLDNPINVKGDRIGIQAIIRNLIDNSMKYSPNSGTIDIGLLCINNKAILEIKNDVDAVAYQNNFSKNRGLGLQLINEILTYNHGKTEKIGLDGDTYHVIVSFTMA